VIAIPKGIGQGQVAVSGTLAKTSAIGVALPQVNRVVVKPGRRVISFLTRPEGPSIQHCGMDVAPGDMIINNFDLVHQRV
jgi:hypothetical protein